MVHIPHAAIVPLSEKSLPALSLLLCDAAINGHGSGLEEYNLWGPFPLKPFYDFTSTVNNI